MQSTFKPRTGAALYRALNSTLWLSDSQRLEAEREMVNLDCDRKQRAIDGVQMISDKERVSLKLIVEIERLRRLEAVDRGEFSYCRKSRWS